RIGQIEKLMGELHEARNRLESERERIQRETARYIRFTQMASASVKIIFDTLSGWRQAGHPLSEFVTRSPADDSTGRMGRSFGSAPTCNGTECTEPAATPSAGRGAYRRDESVHEPAVRAQSGPAPERPASQRPEQRRASIHSVAT